MSLYTFIDKSIYFPEAEVCIISDIHFSAENIHQTAPTVSRRVKRILQDNSIQTLILNGDTFSEYPFPPKSIELLKELNTQVHTLILLPGNHEESVGGFGRLDGEFLIQDEYTFTSENQNIVVTHGHRRPKSKGDLYVIGHIHPEKNGTECAVRISSSYQGSDVIALPTFTSSDTTPIEFAKDASPMINPSLGISDPYQIESRF